MMKKKLLFLFALVAAFSFCGKKGPLVFEPENVPPAVDDFRVRQIGGQIELAWNFPAFLNEKKDAFEPSWVAKVYVYHEILKPGDEPSADSFTKKAELLAKLKPDEIKGYGLNSPFCRFTFKSRDLVEKVHGFAVVYYYARKRSAPGPLRTIRTRLTPPPIQDLQLSRQGKTVTLGWSRPVTPAKEPVPPPINGYHVYRRIRVAGGEADFRPLSAKPVINEFYYDIDTGSDGDYEYQVSSRLDDVVESAPSNTVQVRIQDTFPPDIPNNLVSFTAKDRVFLTWESVPDKDLASYRLYRKAAEAAEFALLADALSDNFFNDRQVVHGKTYIYAVTSVDRKGNESDFSRPVRQFFE